MTQDPLPSGTPNSKNSHILEKGNWNEREGREEGSKREEKTIVKQTVLVIKALSGSSRKTLWNTTLSFGPDAPNFLTSKFRVRLYICVKVYS